MLTQATDLALKRAGGTGRRSESATGDPAGHRVEDRDHGAGPAGGPRRGSRPLLGLGRSCGPTGGPGAEVPDVTAALDWQVRRAIQLVQAKMGAPAPARSTWDTRAEPVGPPRAQHGGSDQRDATGAPGRLRCPRSRLRASARRLAPALPPRRSSARHAGACSRPSRGPASPGLHGRGRWPPTSARSADGRRRRRSTCGGSEPGEACSRNLACSTTKENPGARVGARDTGG